MGLSTNVKGTALLASVRFVNERFGAAGLRKVTDSLPIEDRAPIEAGVLASAWYPFSTLLRFMRATREQFGGQAPDVIKQMGRASAEYALTGIYKIFVKVGSPQFIISRGSAVMKTYYTTGDMRAVLSERGHAVLEMVDFGEPAPEFCERLEGWMHRTVELSGGKGCRMVHDKCVNRGDVLCRFEGWWS